MKEGLILYTGIRYTPNLSDLEAWPSDFTLFLDTEYVFNFAGYNGSVFRDIFMDFYQLVIEMNRTNRRPGRRKIELRYFSETKREIEDFFHVATLIIERKAVLDPTKTAMKEILSGCKSASDIIMKKSHLFQSLKDLQIIPEEPCDYYKNHTYVLEGDNTVEQLRIFSIENDRYFDADDARKALTIFTKVNVLRRGQNSTGLERVGYIFSTATSALLLWSHCPYIKQNEKDIPFATTLDFITDKFWFKLKKGLNDKKALPRSQDIITKAQIVLSSQLTKSISKRYTELTSRSSHGTLSQDEALSTYAELRDLFVNPEDITPEVIDDSHAFLRDDNLERFLQERSSLIRKAKEGEEALKQLKKLWAKQLLDKKKVPKRRAKYAYDLMLTGYFLFVAIFLVLLAFGINLIRQREDTPIAVAALVVGIIPILGIIKMKKTIRWMKRLRNHQYIEAIQKIDFQ